MHIQGDCHARPRPGWPLQIGAPTPALSAPDISADLGRHFLCTQGITL